jgi:DNA-binding NarL/FixJ family response regulator
MNDRPTRIFLVDDHPLVCEWLANLINQSPDLIVCGAAAGCSQALQGIAASKPDVAIVDLSLAEGSGLDVIRNIKTYSSNTRIVVLSMHDERFYAERAIRCGARAYVMKSEATGVIIHAIDEVARGRVYLSPSLNAGIVEGLASGASPCAGTGLDRLSNRELEVFRLLGRAYGTRRIAASLNVSIKTVQTFCARIKDKLQYDNAPELIREAMRWHNAQAPAEIPALAEDQPQVPKSVQCAADAPHFALSSA